MGSSRPTTRGATSSCAVPRCWTAPKTSSNAWSLTPLPASGGVAGHGGGALGRGGHGARRRSLWLWQRRWAGRGGRRSGGRAPSAGRGSRGGSRPVQPAAYAGGLRVRPRRHVVGWRIERGTTHQSEAELGVTRHSSARRADGSRAQPEAGGFPRLAGHERRPRYRQQRYAGDPDWPSSRLNRPRAGWPIGGSRLGRCGSRRPHRRPRRQRRTAEMAGVWLRR